MMQSSLDLIEINIYTIENYLSIKVLWAADCPVGHGEDIAGALGHLHPPT